MTLHDFCPIREVYKREVKVVLFFARLIWRGSLTHRQDKHAFFLQDLDPRPSHSLSNKVKKKGVDAVLSFLTSQCPCQCR